MKNSALGDESERSYRKAMNAGYTPMARPAAHYPTKSPHNVPWPDENSHQYFCCCGNCHVRRGTMIVGVVELVWAGFHFVYAIQNFARGGAVAPSSLELLFSTIFLCVVLLMIYGVYKEKHRLLIPHLAWSIIFIIAALLIACIVITAWLIGGAAAAIMIANRDEIEKRIWQGEGDDFDDPYPPENETISSAENDDDDITEDMNYYFEPPAPPPKTHKSIAPKEILLLVVIGLLVTFVVTIIFEIWFFVIILACWRYLRDKERYFASSAMCAEGIPLKNMVA